MSQINHLIQLGLNENEAKTYIALLKLGQSNINNLSSEISIARTTLYYSIQGLKEKGFAFERLKGKKRFFSPRQPEFLAKKAQNQLNNAKIVNDKVKDLISSLKKLVENLPSYSKVEHYEGKEGVWEVFENILRSSQDSLWFGFGESFLNNYDFEYFLNNFTKKRRQFGRTKSYNIIPSFEKALKIARRGETDFQEFHFLDNKIQFNAGICVFGNRIAIFSYEKELSATILESSAIAKIVRTMFFMIWDNKRSK